MDPVATNPPTRTRSQPSRAAHVLQLADLRPGRRRRGRGRASPSSATLRGAKAPVDWVAWGPSTDFPPDETRLVTFDNPIRQPWDGMVAHTASTSATRARTTGPTSEPVPGPRRQLCPPGLSGVLVPAVGPVHVPVPRRRLLRQRRTRLGAAAARPVPLRLAGRDGQAGDPGAALPDLAGHARSDDLGDHVEPDDRRIPTDRGRHEALAAPWATGSTPG